MQIFDPDNWKEITATLARNKTRTLLTAFGIFWGTAMLALLLGSSKGLRGLLMANFEGFASNSAVVYAQRTTMPYRGYKKGMTWSLTTGDVDNIRRLVPEFEVVSPVVSRSATLKHGDKTFGSQIQGVDGNFMDVLSPIIVAGRFVNAKDMHEKARVCAIGVNVASSLFGDSDPVGRYIEADNMYYKVVGVIKQRSDISINGRIDDQIMYPITTVQSTYNIGDKIDFLFLIARDGYSPTQLRPRMYRALRIRHPLHPDDTGNMFFMDISEQFEMVGHIFTGVDVLLIFVGLSSLIAGIIGVGNIMWIIVKERTKEFGIRRALGAKPRTIMSQILAESAILTSIAGTAGICFAVLILGVATPLISQASELAADFQLDFSGAVLIMVLFLTLGTAAGAIPAVKAMKIKPIEALNDK